VFELKPLGELLLLSPRQDELAWAKIAVLSHCSTPAKPETTKHFHTDHSHTNTFTFQIILSMKQMETNHILENMKKDLASLT